MVQTVVTLQKMDFKMAVSLPVSYVGKEVHVLFYIDEEVKKQMLRFCRKKPVSIFWNT
jgi:hypothetical protein